MWVECVTRDLELTITSHLPELPWQLLCQDHTPTAYHYHTPSPHPLLSLPPSPSQADGKAEVSS